MHESKASMKLAAFWLGIGILLVFMLDQITKFLIVENVFGFSFWNRDLFFSMIVTPILPITQFFNIVLLGNRGVSFSLFPADSWTGVMIFVIISLVISGFLIYWTLMRREKYLIVCTSLIVGGALGNVLDRVRFGAVVDFLHLHIEEYAWPVFNIADTTICLGVVLWIVYSLFGGRKKTQAEGKKYNSQGLQE